MLISEEHLLKSRVSTLLGSLLLMSWAFGCGLVLWQASFNENPVANAFMAALNKETQL